MKRAGKPRSKTTELGERLRGYAAQYLSSDQKERAEGLAQAADLVDDWFSFRTPTMEAAPSDLEERVASLERTVFADRSVVPVHVAEARAAARVRSDRAFVPRVVRPPAPKTRADKGGLSPCERAILHACIQMEGAASVRQIGILSEYRTTSGSFGAAVTALRAAGYLEGSKAHLVVTDDGRAAAGAVAMPPRGAEYLPDWERLGHTAIVLLRAIAAEHPTLVSREELGTKTGYRASSGSFGAALTKLRALRLIARGEIMSDVPLFGLTPHFVQRWEDRS